MVLTSSGVILTNNHVIDGATSISVTDVGNGKTYSANVVGYDRTGDVAVIKLVNASGLQTVSIASGTAAVGQAVVGIGNAGGSGGTPSAAGGSVTALAQSITASDDNGGNSENLSGLIEVNAGIEPGDSGGSLVNASGQVLGMDTAASEDSTYEVSGTQAYAIPIHTALTIAKQIEAGKASTVVHIGATGFLGVSVEASSTSSGTGEASAAA
jgi:S1-C subfamily serine protease